MKTNWLKTVNQINSKRYTIPEGWETREQVAESLHCDLSKVHDILKPGIQSGDIDKQDFPVWDEKRRMAVKVPCYRLAGEKREAPAKPVRGASVEERIRAAILKRPGQTDRQIAKNYGVRSVDVAAVRATM